MAHCHGEQCHGGGCCTPHLSPEMLTQIPKTDLPTLVVTQLKDRVLLCQWHFWTTGNVWFSEVTSPTLLVRSCMYCGLRKHYPYVTEQVLECVQSWETPAKPAWRKASDTEQAPSTYWCRPKERNAADLLLVKTLVMNRKLDCQGGHPRTDTQPCSWPLPHQATWLLCFYFDAPSLQQSFSSTLMKEGRNTLVCLSALSSPKQEWPSAHSRFQLGASIFTRGQPNCQPIHVESIQIHLQTA